MHLLLAAARGTTDVAHVRSVGALVARAGVSLGRALRPRVRRGRRGARAHAVRRRAAYSSAAAAAEIRGSTATDHARDLRSDVLRLLRRASPRLVARTRASVRDGSAAEGPERTAAE